MQNYIPARSNDTDDYTPATTGTFDQGPYTSGTPIKMMRESTMSPSIDTPGSVRESLLSRSPSKSSTTLKRITAGKALEAEIAVPFFLKWYPLITLAISLAISSPIIWYKYTLAVDDETKLAEESFKNMAFNLVKSIDASWQHAMLGGIVMANSMIGLAQNMTEFYFDRLTDPDQYFSYFNSSTQVGVYRYVAAGDDEIAAKNYLLANYGPNFPNSNNFEFLYA
ncbi:hypothetical protein HDU76_013884 [Blyttiomyces sp. JEL0837]|nr:hypothetical protein HDU76_013884 [Blyttiomyces sp. JEL0837]